MLDKIKKFFWKQPKVKPEVEVEKPKKSKPVKKELSEKDKVTANNEPYIAITKVEINPENVNDGVFELDFNDKFVINLIRAGYKIRDDDTDDIIVDRWFQTVCRNVALEMYDQIQADPEKRDIRYQIHTRKLDDGRTEIG